GGEDARGRVARRRLREQTRELGALLLTEGRRDVAEPGGLLLDRLHDLRMAVTEVHVDEAGREVEDAALAGVEPGPFGAVDEDLGQRALRGPRDEDVLARLLGDARRIDPPLGVERHVRSVRPRRVGAARAIPPLTCNS